MPARLDASASGFAEALAGLLDRRRSVEGEADRAAAEIIARVRAEGDAALIDLTRRFDRVQLTAETLRIGPADLAAAAGRCSAEDRAALSEAAQRIRAYHERQLP